MISALASKAARLEISLRMTMKMNVEVFGSYRLISSPDVYCFSNVRLNNVHDASNWALNVGAE